MPEVETPNRLAISARGIPPSLALGDLTEQSVHQALMITGENPAILFQSAIAKTLFGLAVFVLGGPILLQKARQGSCRTCLANFISSLQIV